MSEALFCPLSFDLEYPLDEMRQRSVAFGEQIQRPHAVRDFAKRPAPREIVEQL
jgi:hypothetical protein